MAMKFLRFKKDRKVSYGIVRGEELIRVKGSPFISFKETGDVYRISEVKILAPCLPSKIICVGLNYRDHAKELRMNIPREPVLFIKPRTALLAHEEPILYPEGVGQLDYEAELGVVVRRNCYKLKEKDARKYILGYTCFNDVTARDLQRRDGQWTRAKSFNTFAPLGPFIVTGIHPGNLRIKLRLNNEIRQSSNTSEMIFSPQKLLWFISHIMSLKRGDVIACGTPPHVGPMKRGDTAEVIIEKVGVLRNCVK